MTIFWEVRVITAHIPKIGANLRRSAEDGPKSLNISFCRSWQHCPSFNHIISKNKKRIRFKTVANSSANQHKLLRFSLLVFGNCELYCSVISIVLFSVNAESLRTFPILLCICSV